MTTSTQTFMHVKVNNIYTTPKQRYGHDKMRRNGHESGPWPKWPGTRSLTKPKISKNAQKYKMVTDLVPDHFGQGPDPWPFHKKNAGMNKKARSNFSREMVTDLVPDYFGQGPSPWLKKKGIAKFLKEWTWSGGKWGWSGILSLIKMVRD